MIKKNIAKASVYFDKRYSKIDGTHPVKIRVTYKRISKYFPTRLFFDVQKFDDVMACELLFAQKVNDAKYYSELIEYKRELDRLLNGSTAIINNLYEFNFQLFEQEYFFPEIDIL